MASYVLYGLNGYELSNWPWWNVSKGTIKIICRPLLSMSLDRFNLMIIVEVRIPQRRQWQDPLRFQLNPGIAF